MRGLHRKQGASDSRRALLPGYTGLHIGIPSANRPHHVPEMEAHTMGRATWYVPEEQKSDYQYAGAANVRGVPTPQYPKALNWILADAWSSNKVAVLTDDDFRNAKIIREFNTNGEGKHDFQPARFMECITQMYSQLMLRPDAKLAGVAPTDNPFFSRRPITTTGFCSSKMMVIEPCDLWFDETMSLKFDYDYTLQHLIKYGEVVRVDKVVTRYDSGTAKGGCQEYRTDNLERSMVDLLTKRYPQWVSPNTRRGDGTEIQLRWKPDVEPT